MPISFGVGSKQSGTEEAQKGAGGSNPGDEKDPNETGDKQPAKISKGNVRDWAWWLTSIGGIVLALCLWFPPYDPWRLVLATATLIAAITFPVIAYSRHKRLSPSASAPQITDPSPAAPPTAVTTVTTPATTKTTTFTQATVPPPAPQVIDAVLNLHMQNLQQARAQLIAVVAPLSGSGGRTMEDRLNHEGSELLNTAGNIRKMLQYLDGDIRERLTQQFRVTEKALSKEGFSKAVDAKDYIRNIDLMDKALNELLTTIIQERDQYRKADDRSKQERDHYKNLVEGSIKERDQFQKAAEQSKQERDQFQKAATQSKLERDQFQKAATQSKLERDQYEIMAGNLEKALHDLLGGTGAPLPAIGKTDALVSASATCQAQLRELISALQEFSLICGVNDTRAGLEGLVSTTQDCRTALESRWLMAGRMPLLDESALLARLATMASIELSLVPGVVPEDFEVLKKVNIASVFASDKSIMEALKLTRQEMTEEKCVRTNLRDWLVRNWWYPCSSALRLASHWRSPLVAETIVPETLQTVERLAWALASLFQMTGIILMKITPFQTELDRSIHQTAPNDLFSSAEMIERLKAEVDSGRLEENTIFQVLQWGYTCPSEEVAMQMASVAVYWSASYKALFGVEPPNIPDIKEQRK